MKLTDRMQAICNLVTPGNRVCDVGCDHGYVPIYLVENGISPAALAMDINKGPLEAAGENVNLHKLSDKITLRLSNGLSKLERNETETVIIAGMGGKLVLSILEEAFFKIKDEAFGIKEFILQPQSDIEYFRSKMTQYGFIPMAEDMILEDGKFYPMTRYIYSGNKDTVKKYFEKYGIAYELINLYGLHLLCDKNEVLKAYLLKEQRHLAEVMEKLSNIADEDSRKIRESQIEGKRRINEKALEIINRKEDL
ncbi:MAG: SAM-dependent methyltransferase [Lachnospiraceae bacterium]|nr:SAM-dependent methyltransferase [Lachnospiraceae bacterium]